MPRLDLRRQVPVCGRDDPNVNPDAPVGTHPLHIAVPEGAKKLWLERQRKLPNLVEEERSPAGDSRPHRDRVS